MTTLEFKPQLIASLRNYNRQKFMADLMAGIIVGIVALPLAIAFGIASGVTPEKGIITAIVARRCRLADPRAHSLLLSMASSSSTAWRA